MTVGELIAHLRQYDPAMPVALADWNEEYRYPSLGAADQLCVIETRTLEHITTTALTVVLGMAET